MKIFFLFCINCLCFDLEKIVNGNIKCGFPLYAGINVTCPGVCVHYYTELAYKTVPAFVVEEVKEFTFLTQKTTFLNITTTTKINNNTLNNIYNIKPVITKTEIYFEPGHDIIEETTITTHKVVPTAFNPHVTKTEYSPLFTSTLIETVTTTVFHNSFDQTKTVFHTISVF